MSTDPSSALILLLSNAARLAADAERAARLARSRTSTAIHKQTRIRADALTAAADEKAMHRLLARIVWIPVLRGHLLSKHSRRARAHENEAESTQTRIDSLKKRVQQFEKASVRLQRIGSGLDKALAAVDRIGIPPRSVEDSAIRISAECAMLIKGRRGDRWLRESIRSTHEAAVLVREWVRQRMEIERRNSVPKVIAAPPSVVKRERRIHLPIPSSMGPVARNLGARRDDTGRRSISPWYVTTEQDLSPFRNLLPLAYRPERTGLVFPPTPYRAKGQNLWGFFDRSTWDRIRKASYDMTGHRCIVCGNRGGFIADKVLGPEQRRHGVDCHEVWDWSTDDQSSGIGVQTLKRLLVVCPSCHACFHSEYFTHLGEQAGIGDAVRDHIEKRRMLITRQDLDTLHQSLETQREHMRSLQGIDTWVVDLEHIGRQQFMTDHRAVMNERNGALVPPERIAGLTFETQSGILHEARSVEAIVADLLAHDLGDPERRVPGM